jgi:hypothetical protein
MDGKARAQLSRSKSGAVKLEYLHEGKNVIALWEPFSTGILETVFNNEGAVMRQTMLKCASGKKEIDEYVGSLAGALSVDAENVAYSEVRLKKDCPKCGSPSLERLVDLDAEKPNVPAMPTYTCTSCQTRSYYMSDEYLEHILSGNVALLSDEEKAEMERNRDAFKAELKEYIIRIFASKRIMRIK